MRGRESKVSGQRSEADHELTENVPAMSRRKGVGIILALARVTTGTELPG